MTNCGYGFLGLLVASIISTGTAQAEKFVKREGSRLLLEGREYRAIGANAPSLFSDYAGTNAHLNETYGGVEKARQNAVQAIQDAAASGIAFLRFWASGFWPIEMKLYFEKPELYWRYMDELFDLCRKHEVKLVPCIFFNWQMWALICGEDLGALADSKSKTYAAMREYARELVSRYKEDENILMWELANEAFLSADINVEAWDAPPEPVLLSPSGKKKLRVTDSVTTAMLLSFYKDMTTFIKKIDPNHLVTSGDSGPRETSVSLRENFPNNVWVMDSLRQNLSSLLASQPEPLEVFSIHSYGGPEDPRPEEAVGGLTSLEYLRSRVRCIHSAQAPVFVGELGNSKPSFKEDPQAKWSRAAIDLLEKEGASLAAIWAWHFPGQPENNVTSKSHPWLVKRIKAFNAKYVRGK